MSLRCFYLVCEKIYQLSFCIQEGELVRCERLATTLELVASQGADAFYTGSIADNIVKAVCKQN